MRRDQLNRRIHQTSSAANAERHKSPQIIQRGKAVRAGGGGGSDIRIAYCKESAPDDNKIDVYLDEDVEGEEVTAICLIINGSSLMYSAPFLNVGDPVFVSRLTVDGTPAWYIIGVPFCGARFKS